MTCEGNFSVIMKPKLTIEHSISNSCPACFYWHFFQTNKIFEWDKLICSICM